MLLDPVFLARVQFGLTITFHIIFPTMSIGLAAFLTIVEGVWLKTGDQLYLRIYRFWLKIFALGFGVGVVSGLVLSFELGTNFSGFSRIAGPVIGPMIALEVLTAFFLEAGFLGIMLFGMGRVGPKLHFFATLMVALGTTISAAWILAANSWMHTPHGVVYDAIAGKFEVIDRLQVIFNPSYLVRLPHMLLAAYIAVSFFIAGVAAFYLLRQRHLDFARRTLSLSLGFGSIAIAAQLSLGDTLAFRMADYQPAKFQAMEGYWEPTANAAYLLFITPNQQEERNGIQFGIPYLGSLMLTHSLTGTVHGLKETLAPDRPPMGAVFYAFRTMFLLGLLMFATASLGIWLRLRKRLFSATWFHRLLMYMIPVGFIATVAGWYTSEIGRQPWVIYGYLRTADAVSPVPANSMLFTLILFAITYTVFLVSFIAITCNVIRKGPSDIAAHSPYGGSLKRALMIAKPGNKTPYV
ncbi:cytochrome ubiquinol oxidase subunit I [Pseudomonas sp. PCH199]|uniref:cytochrome ubiquinol oxidase subunit I n=1 Tax=unclassified Pseudomonas TaxID=196821 RepID=UPI000BD7550F|nr:MULTISPECIES: cytochrome ubiquinol oxidase subunit I [unclassified Pseudomonas]MCW8279109.1 cytochrome ubiquinol oxidase subunit I [Pseudomonas sp. PCH199]PAM79622.1 cytochrome ubiquinol oxidase subunit I [Pseudomonas sp. ERMR1:02]